MRRIIYISRSLVGADADVLDAIVTVSSARNAAAGITGILWSGNGEFVQALEGGKDEIGKTFERIAADRRHTQLEIVCECTVQSRMFGFWSMLQSDRSAGCTIGTAYLIGYLARQPSFAARRASELLLTYSEAS